MSTHSLRIGPSTVTKTYRWTDRDQPQREWDGLRLLHRYAPGLAPEPIAASLDVIPPTVTMSRLPGSPVTGPVTGPLADALAAAITRLHDAIPAPDLTHLPTRAGAPSGLLTQVKTWWAEGLPPWGPAEPPLEPGAPLRQPDVSPPEPEASPREPGASTREPEAAAREPGEVVSGVIREAYEAAGEWLARGETGQAILRPGRPVFGTGDGNVRNFLWDGDTVRVIDLEFCGRSDRPYEIAEVVEHISAWDNDRHGLLAVLDRLPLSPAETSRLTECRRLFALYWFLRLLPEAGTPDGRAEPAAQRLLTLL